MVYMVSGYRCLFATEDDAADAVVVDAVAADNLVAAVAAADDVVVLGDVDAEVGGTVGVVVAGTAGNTEAVRAVAS
jgi:hypothetical protein